MSGDADLNKKVKNIKLNEKGDINILLLGETGVGKSTFINSVANYLTYSDLKKAEKENLLILIPSKCSLKDKNEVDHIVNIGSVEDQNDYLEGGVPATQDVKTYVFPIWNGRTKVRLIDTPGMGDTRGTHQDDVNCENILSYIGQLHELHAICFLFSPTNTAITKFFDYCMSRIFSRLDKSASKNIIFIFTNTRGTDYGPGYTLSVLQDIVNNIESAKADIKIPINRNIFCFDNEAFRYLAGIKQGIEFDNSVKEKSYESWKKSTDQCWKLIKYIIGDAGNHPLKPLFIKSPSAINEARRMIVRLLQPLAEIAQLVNDNLFALQKHQELLTDDGVSIDELKKKLYIPVIDLKAVRLNQPITVCTSSKCAEIYKIGDTNKWYYKQKCHDPCYLKNVPEDIIGSPELVQCETMNSATGVCQKCSCMLNVHMHIYYLTQTVEDSIVDPSVQQNIFDKQQVMQKRGTLSDEISQRKTELEKEHDSIVKCCARFAHFLQTTAITPFSDSYKEYIQYLILREKNLGVLSNIATVHHLERLLTEYEEAKTTFDEALQLQRKLGESDVYVTPQKIQDSIQELYKLKHSGKKIKELHECQKTSRNKEYEYTEYIHNTVLKPVKSDTTKADKKKDNKGGDTSKSGKADSTQVDKKKDKKGGDAASKSVKADTTQGDKKKDKKGGDAASKPVKADTTQGDKQKDKKGGDPASKPVKADTTQGDKKKDKKGGDPASKPVKADITEGDKKKDKKGSEPQKNPSQPKQGQKGNAKESSQPKNVTNKNQQKEQRGRARTPPPPYQGPSHNFPPPPPHYSPQDPGRYPPPPQGAYQPPPPPHGGYQPPPPPQGTYQPPGPYPPPTPPAPGPHPYHYAPGYDNRGSSGQSGATGSTYEFKISVKKENQDQNVSLPGLPPNQQHSPHGYYNYPPSYSQGSYPTAPGGHPSAPGAYPPPQSAYPPPPGGYPQNYGSGYHGNYNQGHGNADNRRGGGRGRGGKGRGGTNRTQKFKKGFHKKKNDGQNDNENDSDEGSDSSSASSKN